MIVVVETLALIPDVVPFYSVCVLLLELEFANCYNCCCANIWFCATWLTQEQRLLGSSNSSRIKSRSSRSHCHSLTSSICVCVCVYVCVCDSFNCLWIVVVVDTVAVGDGVWSMVPNKASSTSAIDFSFTPAVVASAC